MFQSAPLPGDLGIFGQEAMFEFHPSTCTSSKHKRPTISYGTLGSVEVTQMETELQAAREQEAVEATTKPSARHPNPHGQRRDNRRCRRRRRRHDASSSSTRTSTPLTVSTSSSNRYFSRRPGRVDSASTPGSSVLPTRPYSWRRPQVETRSSVQTSSSATASSASRHPHQRNEFAVLVWGRNAFSVSTEG